MPKSQLNIRMPLHLIEKLKLRAQSLGITLTELLIRLASQPLEELEPDLDSANSPLSLNTASIKSSPTAKCQSTSKKPLSRTETNLDENQGLCTLAISQLELCLTGQLAQQQEQIAQLLAAVNRLQTSRPLDKAGNSSLTSAPTTLTSVNFKCSSKKRLQASTRLSPMTQGSNEDTLDINSAYAYAQAQGYPATLDAFLMLVKHRNPEAVYARWNLSVDLQRLSHLGQKTKWLRPLDREHYYHLMSPN